MKKNTRPELSVLRGEMQRSVGVEVGVVDGDVLVLEQDLGELRPAVLRGEVERAVPVVVALVHVGALQQQVLHYPRAPVLRRNVQHLRRRQRRRRMRAGEMKRVWNQSMTLSRLNH